MALLVNTTIWIKKHERNLKRQGIAVVPSQRLDESEPIRLARENYRLRQRVERLQAKPQELTRKFQAAERLVQLVREYMESVTTKDHPLIAKIDEAIRVFETR